MASLTPGELQGGEGTLYTLVGCLTWVSDGQNGINTISMCMLTE